MNIKEKLAYVKQAIRSITEHDDAPAGEVAAAVGEVQAFAGNELKKATKRRADKANAEKKTKAGA